MPASNSEPLGFWRNVAEIAVLLLIVFFIRTFGFGLYQVPTGSMETTMLVGERFFADKLTPYFSSIKRREIIAFNNPLYPYSKNRLKRLFQDYVWGPSNWTKRVIGVPGDRIKGVIKDGKPVIFLNGKELFEPYVNQYPLIKVWKVKPQEVKAQLQANTQRTWDLMTPKSFDPHRSLNDQILYRIEKDRVVIEGKEPSMVFPGTPIRSFKKKKHEVGEQYWDGSDEFYVELGPNQFWVMGDNRLGSKDSRVFGPIDGRLIHGRIIFRIWSIDSDESWWIWDLIKHPIDFWKRIRTNRFFQRIS